MTASNVHKTNASDLSALNMNCSYRNIAPSKEEDMSVTLEELLNSEVRRSLNKMTAVSGSNQQGFRLLVAVQDAQN